MTPNRADGGLDFVGQHHFLEDDALGIAAAITIGGQCKKRTSVNDIVEAVAGSLARMDRTIKPTFFIVALSANLTRSRVDAAREILEDSYRRNCHILDRRQIEGLVAHHLPALDEIFEAALAAEEAETIRTYFREHLSSEAAACDVSVIAPDRILAGVPFRVALDIRSSIAQATASRLRWRPAGGTGGEAHPVALIGPIGADRAGGARVASGGDDPVNVKGSVELVTYAVGKVNLGEVTVAAGPEGSDGAPAWVGLGSVLVVENLRPRFFERPVRAGMERLGREYERALAGGAATVGVIGSGGSGKSRLCEEFALERRRRGAEVVAAKQAKTLNDPARLLADLFLGLVGAGASLTGPADRVIQAIERYDPPLAGRSEAALRAIFGSGEQRAEASAEQDVLSAMLLLIMVRVRSAPLIVHLQDLHWCTADVLMLLERLLWQLGHVLSPNGSADAASKGALFVFEGRVRERQAPGEDGWASEPFEAFLQKLDCTTVRCAPFAPEDGLEFIRRLFEDHYSAQRMVSDDLLDLQRQLIEEIDRTAGGNPFHSLEQVQLLRERRVLGQNPATGLLYLIQPAPQGSLLPESVFEAIQTRWRYLKARAPELALLIWAAALLEDRVPAPLFRSLWRELAPEASLSDIEATDVLWTGDGEQHEVAFRHENYFRSIRRFEVSAEERRRVVEVYANWFDGAEKRDPVDRFRWARALLELSEPDLPRARALLDSALSDARLGGDARLARRISATALDLSWDEDARAPVEERFFLRRCDDELALVRELLDSDRFQANDRLGLLRVRLDKRLDGNRGEASAELQRRHLTAEVLRSQILFNDRQPAIASEVSARAVSGIRALRQDPAAGDRAQWETLEMEALHSQAVALALSGEIDQALNTAEVAVEMAREAPSVLSQRVLSTFANILLARNPEVSEEILRQCLRDIAVDPSLGEVKPTVEINLGMALALRGYQAGAANEDGRAMLAEARAVLKEVFSGSFQIGRYPNAAAAALMLGIVSALEGTGDDIAWFAQAVAAASRGHKMETLWRAHVNMATSLYRREGSVTASVHDHARAALEILEETLSPYSQPDRSARFALVRIPLAQAVRFLVAAGDEAGSTALVRYPGLGDVFEDVELGTLQEDRGNHSSHEWVRIGGEDYVIY